MSLEDRPLSPEEATTSSLPSASKMVSEVALIGKLDLSNAYYQLPVEATTSSLPSASKMVTEVARKEPPAWLKNLMEIKRAQPNWPGGRKK